MSTPAAAAQLPGSCRSVTLPFPVIDNDEPAKLIHINADGDMPGMKAATLSGLYRVSGGGDALAARIEEICAETDAAIEDGARLIVLSDRHSDAEHAPIPSLLPGRRTYHRRVISPAAAGGRSPPEQGSARSIPGGADEPPTGAGIAGIRPTSPGSRR